MKDWEIHAARLHSQPSNLKFINGTRRMSYDLPVIEQYDRSSDFADLVILVAACAILGVIVITFAFDLLPRLGLPA
jgi:catalase (peroxidase I)